ncbi:hypothetical protein [Streptomyces radiopugnans]|uniref:Lysine transporter LysE n=1 Tax=Streptomyces radiopugnans TaxID=403935 RepID=A0A1H8ZDR4_9ACTN|nr:hypothetical protein [Streptomyces radiopugnans]SEP62511.1 hypothetical protein SAMN05216481_101475 [Streptomyces radiopugnans]
MAGGRVARAARKTGEHVAESVAEMLLEAALAVVACLILAAGVAVFLAGWRISPFVAGGSLGGFLLLVGYGAREAFRSGKPARRGRLATVAVAAFALVVLVLYGASCECL